MNTLLIRAEDKNRWEKRAPLVPADVQKIVQATGDKVLVERSNKRFFNDESYERAGAVLCSDMEGGDIILGVKEIPESKLLDQKTYAFFSHTIKGQRSGMPLLRKIMAGGSTLIDYEKVTDQQNRRLIFFGRYAGDAGAIDILSLMGEYWQHRGIETPLTKCRRAHQYTGVQDARGHLKKIGDEIRGTGIHQKIAPLVIGILGYGNVSRGAQQIFDCLPLERISTIDLAQLADRTGPDPKTVYLTVFKEEDIVRRRDGSAFSLEDYYDYPERYESSFEAYLPHISILVNAIYWEERYPRFVTWEALRKLYRRQRPAKLCGIADITCDTHGSVECNVRSTDSAMPAYRCDPMTETVSDGHVGDGIVVLAVDNLPCELPADSSVFFSGQLKPFIPNLIRADFFSRFETSRLCPEISKAVIVYRGELTPAYRYLKRYLG